WRATRAAKAAVAVDIADPLPIIARPRNNLECFNDVTAHRTTSSTASSPHDGGRCDERSITARRHARRGRSCRRRRSIRSPRRVGIHGLSLPHPFGGLGEDQEPSGRTKSPGGFACRGFFHGPGRTMVGFACARSAARVPMPARRTYADHCTVCTERTYVPASTWN